MGLEQDHWEGNGGVVWCNTLAAQPALPAIQDALSKGLPMTPAPPLQKVSAPVSTPCIRSSTAPLNPCTLLSIPSGLEPFLRVPCTTTMLPENSHASPQVHNHTSSPLNPPLISLSTPPFLPPPQVLNHTLFCLPPCLPSGPEPHLLLGRHEARRRRQPRARGRPVSGDPAGLWRPGGSEEGAAGSGNDAVRQRMGLAGRGRRRWVGTVWCSWLVADGEGQWRL